MAYDLELPFELATLYRVWHVSLLKKCIGDPSLAVSLGKHWCEG